MSRTFESGNSFLFIEAYLPEALRRSDYSDRERIRGNPEVETNGRVRLQ